MAYNEGSIQKRPKRSIWIVMVVLSSSAIASAWGLKGLFAPTASTVQPQGRVRLSINDGRPVASAIAALEIRFSRVITYEDPPLVNADDTVDVTESVRRDLHKYAPGKAPKVIVPRGGELSIEYSQNDPVEVVLSYLLRESERVTSSASFRTEETKGIIHVIPRSMKGPTGEIVALGSILDAPVQLPAKERTGFGMLQAWQDAVSATSKKRILIGAVPFGMLTGYKDDKGLSSQSAREALTEILLRSGQGVKLSWQLFYDPGQRLYVINIHPVNSQ